MITQVTRFVTAVVLGILPGATAFATESGCYENWSEAALVIEREQLVVVEQLNTSAQARLGGPIVRTRLCAEGDRFVYRLVVRSPAGLKNVSVDAREPFSR